jgi:hypothetical protein
MRLDRAPNAAAAAAYDDTTRSLATERDGAACEALCRRSAAAFDDRFASLAADGAPLACAPGCAFCCHLRVTVFPHEAIALAHYVRTELPPDRAAAFERRIAENARRIAAMSVEEHRAALLPCAFLVDGSCSAHAVRPSACAAYHSLSRERCERAFANPRGVGTPSNSRPALLELRSFAEARGAATAAGLSALGLSSEKNELHGMLRAILEDPSAAVRWAAGGAVANATDDPA